MRHQMTLQRLELLSVLQTDDVVVMDGLLRVDGRLRLFLRDDGGGAAHAPQSIVHFRDQRRKIRSLHGIVADIGRYDVRCQFDQVVRRPRNAITKLHGLPLRLPLTYKGAFSRFHSAPCHCATHFTAGITSVTKWYENEYMSIVAAIFF